MGVRIERFPEYRVTLCIYSGTISREVLREHFSKLEPDDVVRRINYADSTADTSAVDIASLPELKRDLSARLSELLAGNPGVSAIVSDAKTGKLTPEFWTSYIAQDSSFPIEVKAFDNLEAACAWLDLPESGGRAVVAAAKARAPRRATPDSDLARDSSDGRSRPI